MTYGIYKALQIILEEGLENCWARHARHHAALKAGLAAIGIGYSAAEGHQLPMLNAVKIADGIDDAAVRRGLLERFRHRNWRRSGAFKGRVWRIGLMGYGARANNVLLLLSALEQLLAEQGGKFEHGAAVAAANEFYQSHK